MYFHALNRLFQHKGGEMGEECSKTAGKPPLKWDSSELIKNKTRTTPKQTRRAGRWTRSRSSAGWALKASSPRRLSCCHADERNARRDAGNIVHVQSIYGKRNRKQNNLQDFPSENSSPGYFSNTLLPQFPFTQKCTYCLYSFHLSVK